MKRYFTLQHTVFILDTVACGKTDKTLEFVGDDFYAAGFMKLRMLLLGFLSQSDNMREDNEFSAIWCVCVGVCVCVCVCFVAVLWCCGGFERKQQKSEKGALHRTDECVFIYAVDSVETGRCSRKAKL